MNDEFLEKLDRELDAEFRKLVEAEGGDYEEAKWAVEDAISQPTPTEAMEEAVQLTYRVWMHGKASTDAENVRFLFGVFRKSVEMLEARYREERGQKRSSDIAKIREAREWPEFLD